MIHFVWVTSADGRKRNPALLVCGNEHSVCQGCSLGSPAQTGPWLALSSPWGHGTKGQQGKGLLWAEQTAEGGEQGGGPARAPWGNVTDWD